jgi:hypothetical protein
MLIVVMKLACIVRRARPSVRRSRLWLQTIKIPATLTPGRRAHTAARRTVPRPNLSVALPPEVRFPFLFGGKRVRKVRTLSGLLRGCLPGYHRHSCRGVRGC